MLLLYWGYVSGIHGSVAPLLAASFHLGDAEIARLFAWIGVASLLALAAGGAADAIGRRRALLGCAAGLSLAAAASACAQGPASYLAAQLAAFGLGTALLQIASVSISEALPPSVHARGQARAGLALAVGTALPLLAAAALAGRPDGWRGVWAVAALPLLGLPWLARRLPETRWKAGAGRARGAPALRALLDGAYRGDALRALGAVVAIQGAEAAARAWLFYYPVRHLDVDPRSATLLLLGAGGVGLAGFPLGGWLADTRGRRPALLAGAALFAIGVAGFYGSTPPPGAAGLGWLFVSLVALAAGGNGALAVFRAHAAELLPTPVRGTFAGLLAVGGALGWSLSMGAVAALADGVGGVGHAVACVVMAALPAAALLLRKLPAARPFGAALAADAEDGARASRRPWIAGADAS
jgi:AAHS family benzoate transporter-like MFS transporter